MSAPRTPIHQDDGSGFEPPELPLDVIMKCDLICTEFERSWQDGQIAPIEGIKSLMQDKPRDERLWLFIHILPLELEYLTDAGEKPIEVEYECHFPEAVKIVRQCFRHLRKSGQLVDLMAETSSFKDEASATDRKTVTCLECQEQIPAVEIEPGVVKCHLCGSSFFLSDIPSKTGSSILIHQTMGRYQIVGVLGHGAFGTVYKAEDTKLRTIVALKVPRDWNDYDNEAKERFFREARAARRLRHPHIVQVIDIDTFNGLPFLVSEFVDGQSLAERLHQDHPMPVDQAVLLVKNIADALGFAHSKDVIHRDVKPGNIIVDYKGCPYLTDFGLAHQEGEATLTQYGQFLGTWAYASPEQASLEKIDHRSDLFSLGIVLYELLSGVRPFSGNVQEIQLQILKATPQALRKLNAKIPKDLETICLKCLEKLPEKRYQTAGELAKDLQRFLDREPIRARRVSPPERGWRWGRKNPSKVALYLLLVVTISMIVYAITFAYTLQGLYRIQESRETIYPEVMPDSGGGNQNEDDPIGVLMALGQDLKPLNEIKAELTLEAQENERFILDCLNSRNFVIRNEAIYTAERLIFVGPRVEEQLASMRESEFKAKSSLNRIEEQKEDFEVPDQENELE